MQSCSQQGVKQEISWNRVKGFRDTEKSTRTESLWTLGATPKQLEPVLEHLFFLAIRRNSFANVRVAIWMALKIVSSSLNEVPDMTGKNSPQNHRRELYWSSWHLFVAYIFFFQHLVF